MTTASKSSKKKPSLDELFGKTAGSEVVGDVVVDAPVEATAALSEVCETYLALCDKFDAAKKKSDEAKAEMEAAEEAILAQLNQHGTKSISTTSGYRFTCVEKPYYSLPAKAQIEDREKAVLWLKRCGAKELFEETINTQTMTSFLRERVEEGKNIIPLIGRFVKTTLSCVKVAKKKS